MSCVQSITLETKMCLGTSLLNLNWIYFLFIKIKYIYYASALEC